MDLSNPLDAFSDSYTQARARFLQAAAQVASYAADSRGPDDEELYTDVAYYGAHDTANLLVLISATHGVEGYAGSGAQISAMRSGLFNKLPPTVGVLVIHALNAYGFAWDRRVTAEGCDLNRNFIDFSVPLPDNEGYSQLADYLVPKGTSATELKKAQSKLDEYTQLHGLLQFQRARKSGQYTHPTGMFYGGAKPTHARLVLERIARDFLISERQKVIIVDYHSGLGPYGYGELQCEQSSGLRGYEKAMQIFGPSATSADLGTSSSVALFGTQDEFWERELGDKHTYVCLEFGTYDQQTSQRALRDDHVLFAYAPGEANSLTGKAVRAATKTFFYPQRADWMDMLTHRAGIVHRQAISALSGPSL